MKTAYFSLSLATVLACFPGTLTAGEQSEEGPGTVEIGATLTALAESDNSAEVDQGMVFDVSATIPTRNGAWSVLVEATTHPFNLQHPSEPSNASEASLAEFHYNLRALGGDWWIGLLDSKAHIDTSIVANDDKEQFLGAAFTNNPSIAIPENSLGIAYRHEQGDVAPGYSVLSTVQELNGAGSRSEGLFVAAEIFREVGGTIARLGAWTTQSNEFLAEENERVSEQQGLFVSLDRQFTSLALNIRAAAARSGNSARQSFVGIAAQIPWRQNILGIGLGHGRLDGNLPAGEVSRSNYLEIYYRFTALGRFVITPDIQYQQVRGPAGSRGSFSAFLRLRIVS